MCVNPQPVKQERGYFYIELKRENILYKYVLCPNNLYFDKCSRGNKNILTPSGKFQIYSVF